MSSVSRLLEGAKAYHDAWANWKSRVGWETLTRPRQKITYAKFRIAWKKSHGKPIPLKLQREAQGAIGVIRAPRRSGYGEGEGIYAYGEGEGEGEGYYGGAKRKRGRKSGKKTTTRKTGRKSGKKTTTRKTGRKSGKKTTTRKTQKKTQTKRKGKKTGKGLIAGEFY